MTDPRVQYWDSTVFVAFIRGEKEDPKRIETVRTLLGIYDRGGIQIVTSTFAIAEVRALPREDVPGPPVGREEEAESERFDPERFRRVQDALATAIDAEADVLFTYDGAGLRRRVADMLRYDGKIGDPPLRIKEPYIPTGPLFEPTERLEQ